MHIENPCFVHFKDPVEMCKTRGCTIVFHQPQSCNQSFKRPVATVGYKHCCGMFTYLHKPKCGLP